MKAADQEKAFAAKVQSSPEFVSWLLGKTKFKGAETSTVLVRCDNPWYQSRTTGKQSETDILLVFENRGTSKRFALHIENKRLTDRFQPDQPELYHTRAADWMKVPKWGNYEDFEILLIAPLAFYGRNTRQSEIFHRFIAHEEIAAFIPEFAGA